MNKIGHCLATLQNLTSKNLHTLKYVKMFSTKNKTPIKRSNKQSKEEYVRVLPSESDFSQDEKDHYSLTFATRIEQFLNEFTETDSKITGKKAQAANKVIENIPGFAYNDQNSIDIIRKNSFEKIANKIKEVENEIIEEDKLAEQKRINDITLQMEYLQSISDKFVMFENLEPTINRILDNPTCYCYALDMNGNKHNGYSQIEGQEMKSLWDGNPHPSSFESYVDTRKLSN